jgi:hypothetical protein
MSAAREAFALPVMFLTVALLGGMSPGPPVSFVPPPLFALVLAALLTAVLFRSGVLIPARLVQGSRGALANANGVAVIVTLFAATAQAFHLLTPSSGLPLLLFDGFLLGLLINTLVTSPERVELLRSLMVIFGSGFVLKFIILAALSDPTGGRLKRVLLLLVEGATLGTLTQEPMPATVGYIAFFTLLLFLVGVWALSAAPPRHHTEAMTRS